MAQKEALGSFRGVPFYTVSHDRSGGRRAAIFEIPFAERGARFSDVGRKARELTINALVVGPDYRNQRDALMEALEEPGAGLLIHPEYGRLNVVLTEKYRLSESFVDELGMARFSFNCIETDDDQELRQRDPAPALAEVVADGKKVAEQVWNDGVPITPISDLIQACRLQCVQNILSDLTSLNNTISSALQVPSEYAGQIRNLADQAYKLINQPSVLVSAVMQVVEALAYASARVIGDEDGLEQYAVNVEAAANALTDQSQRERAIVAFAELGKATPPAPAIDTEERQAQASERTAMLSSMRAAGLFAIADNLPNYRYDSVRDAGQTRSSLVGEMLLIADRDEIDPRLSAALSDAASAVVTYFRDVVLPDITTYTPATTLPIEVIAYELYQDAERSDELVARNRIADPGLVPGGVPLEVLR